ncbi:MAG: DNA polymerase III subunit gamma/tau [Treponema sp.]|nr:DNA polymerase III subunit gamma/tau [Treponema sp.]
MAYEVTATRRRPQRFEDLAGQEFVAETLKNSIKSSQIAHAYLFAGPRGCGKTSTARILAKALNCQATDGPNPEPCGKCDSCRAITASSSLDVFEIDGASNTSVNDVRQIKDEVMYPAASARYKIYIIDEVHMLSNSAFNALLKTIEEPPSHVIFIFATTELQKVPATIKSRCQQYNFRLVSIDKIKELLEDACIELNIQADSESLYWIAKESGGSVRDSYTLFDQVVAFSDGKITYQKIRDKLGILGIERLNELFEKAVEKKTEETLNILDSLLQSGISVEQIISNSTEYLRSLMLIKSGVTKESLLGKSPERFSQTVLESWSGVQIERALSLFLQLYRDIRYSLSPRYELELAFSKTCWLSEYVSPSEVKIAIEKASALLAKAPVSQSGSLSDTNSVRPSADFSSASQINENSSNIGSYSDTKGAFAGNISQSNNESSSTDSLARDNSAGESSSASPFNASSSPAHSENQENDQDGEMPHFALFDRLKKENQNPFPKGGALPPEKTAAATNTDFSDYDSEYSYAPDDYPDEESEESQDELYEERINEQVREESTEENAGQSSNQIYSEDSHESGDILQSPDGFSISAGKIFGTLAAELSVQNPMLASALMKTKKWHVSANTVQTSINTEYQKNYIEQNSQEIKQMLAVICKMPVDFKIIYEEEKIEKKQEELPVQVKLLCTAFKGTVTGGKL